MLRKSAVAAAVAMLFALPALAQNPPAAPPVRVRGTIEKVDGANLTVKARDGMDVKVAVTDAKASSRNPWPTSRSATSSPPPA